MTFARWLLYFIPALMIEGFCFFTNPIACLFVRRSLQTDVVKRLNKQTVQLPRDNLIWFFKLWQTHDNNVDEGWYGLYDIPFLANKTQADYDQSWLIRYWCRVWWLSRNTAYGWHYWLFSRPKETAHQQYSLGIQGKGFWYSLKLFNASFQFECHIPLGQRYISINIGWKPHKNKPKLLYANRVFGLRKYQK